MICHAQNRNNSGFYRVQICFGILRIARSGEMSPQNQTVYRIDVIP